MTTDRLNPSPLFTDGMVLCRDKEIRVFGEAPEGLEVKASLMDRDGRILAAGSGIARQGRFLVFLPPQTARTGCRLVISGGGETVTAEDAAIGDVYLAGGQSNMELELRNALEGTDSVADDPLLRFFNVPRKAYECDEQRQALAETRWRPVDRETAGYNSAVASYFGAYMRRLHPEVPVGIIGCYWGGTSVTCWMDGETLQSLAEGVRYLEEYGRAGGGKTMEAYLQEEAVFNRNMDRWNGAVAQYKEAHPGAPWEEIEEACGKCPWFPPAGPGSPYRPGGLAESMLKQIAPVTLTAALYYQGEEDAGRTDCYDLLMAAMIRMWRRLFREAELPFLFVQLPMWLDFGAEDTFRWALTRLAQAAARDAVRNTGMVCLLDEGEYGNIHPVNKRPVGERLAELAGHMLRGEGKVSPRAAGRWIRDDVMTVTVTENLVTSDGEAPRLFEVAGEDGVFVPAEAEISERAIRLRAEGVPHPAEARYAWTDWSDRVNVFGENGLPLEPFRI